MNTDEVAKIVLSLVRLQPENEVFNVCGAGCVSLAEVAALAGKPPPQYAVDAPRVECYEVNVSKLQAIVPVPETVATVRAFLRSLKSLS